VRGLSDEAARRVCAARAQARFASVDDLARRAALDRRELSALAAAGALKSLAGHRHLAVWNVTGVEAPLPIEPAGLTPAREDSRPILSAPTEGEDLVADYHALGLTLGRHPLALLRRRFAGAGLSTAAELKSLGDGVHVKSCGLVLVRQRPGSASGVTFVTLEDETGVVNLVVWRQVAERWRRPLLRARLLQAEGKLQRQGEVLHLVAAKLIDRSAMLGQLLARSRDFH